MSQDIYFYSFLLLYIVVLIKINLSKQKRNRHEREEDIWQIASTLRLQISKIANVKQLTITPYGATALASIRASV
ncbi:MAG TPA: hypothetical protein EYG80_05140, partial [Flavobacteriaceae bacterium]|nr:hypothetical protein [Flavobacteriaceae bacterium]